MMGSFTWLYASKRSFMMTLQPSNLIDTKIYSLNLDFYNRSKPHATWLQLQPRGFLFHDFSTFGGRVVVVAFDDLLSGLGKLEKVEKFLNFTSSLSKSPNLVHILSITSSQVNDNVFFSSKGSRMVEPLFQEILCSLLIAAPKPVKANVKIICVLVTKS